MARVSQNCEQYHIVTLHGIEQTAIVPVKGTLSEAHIDSLIFKLPFQVYRITIVSQTMYTVDHDPIDKTIEPDNDNTKSVTH